MRKLTFIQIKGPAQDPIVKYQRGSEHRYPKPSPHVPSTALQTMSKFQGHWVTFLQVTTVAARLSCKVQQVEVISLVPGRMANHALGSPTAVSRYERSEPSKLAPFATSLKEQTYP